LARHKPRKPIIAVAITPRQRSTVARRRPPRCVGYQARQTASGRRLHIQHWHAECLTRVRLCCWHPRAPKCWTTRWFVPWACPS